MNTKPLLFGLLVVSAVLYGALSVVRLAVAVLTHPFRPPRRVFLPQDDAFDGVVGQMVEVAGEFWNASRPHLARIVALSEEVLCLLADPGELAFIDLYDKVTWGPKDPTCQNERMGLLHTALGLLDGEGLVIQKVTSGGGGIAAELTDAGKIAAAHAVKVRGPE